MNVFISWSGQTSRDLAAILREYLPLLIQDLKPFMSKHDLESGARWSQQLADQLETTNFGVLCLTPSNLNSPWLLFESGALTKIADSRACGILFGGVNPSEITGPLSQFQHRSFDREGFFALLHDLNSQVQNRLDDSQLKILFEKLWPDIDTKCTEVLQNAGEGTLQLPKRDITEVLNDLVTAVRDLERRIEGLATSGTSPRIEGLVHQTLGALDDDHLAPLPYVVTAGGQRMAADYDELANTFTPEVIENLTQLGILTISNRQNKKIVELAHDALLAPVMSYFPRIFQRQRQKGT